MFEEAIRLRERGEPFALVTVVRVRGSTPQKPGSRLLVRRDGSTLGTLGGGCVEGALQEAALRALREGRGAEVVHYALNEPIGSPHGMVCGGAMDFLIETAPAPADEILAARTDGPPLAVATRLRPAGRRMILRKGRDPDGTLGDAELDAAAVRKAQELWRDGGTAVAALDDARECYIEVHVPPPLLAAVGGGHIGRAMEPLAKGLGFRFAVIDDRPAFANRDRFVEADEVLVADFAEGLSRLPLREESAVLVATRGHKYDDVALEAALRSRAGYVGLVSSRRKWILIRERLLARGVPSDRVASVHAPVGLDIGARTPEEIALSIVAEVVAWRRGRAGGPLNLRE